MLQYKRTKFWSESVVLRPECIMLSSMPIMYDPIMSIVSGHRDCVQSGVCHSGDASVTAYVYGHGRNTEGKIVIFNSYREIMVIQTKGRMFSRVFYII